MSLPPHRQSRRRAAVLAVAAVIAFVVCLLVDLRFRPAGLTRLALWSGGLVVYGILLSRAVGRAIEWRDRDDRSR
jgi:hypothetical protein